MTELSNFITENLVFLQNCWFFFITFIGATITQLLSFKLGIVGATPFLKMWFEGKSDNWYARGNCIILIIIGTILSFTILEPDSTKTSLFAGLTWCGTLQSIGQTIKSNKHD